MIDYEKRKIPLHLGEFSLKRFRGRHNPLFKKMVSMTGIIILILILECAIFITETFVYKSIRSFSLIVYLRKQTVQIELFNWIRERFQNELLGYSQVVVAVIVAIIVAMLTITITMYTFLKGNLDRSIDENRYIFNMAHSFQDNCVKKLRSISILYLVILVLMLTWHFRIVFLDIHSPVLILVCFILLMAVLGIDTILTIQFWNECVRSREGLSTLCNSKANEYAEEMRKILADRFKRSDDKGGITQSDIRRILFLIGDWDKWDTDILDDYRIDQAINENKTLGIRLREPNEPKQNEIDYDLESVIVDGRSVCDNLTRDQFLNLFSRTEELLLNSSYKKGDDNLDENEIVTIIQERKYIFEAMASKSKGIEYEDLKDSYYKPSTEKTVKVADYVDYYRRRVGFTNRREEQRKEFYDETEKIYKCLLNYRNAKISLRQYSKDNSVEREENDSVDFIMALGLHYFFLRVLCVFTSSVYISDFTFNGGTFNFADFYSSTFENVSMFGSLFYHTIFARTKWIRGTLDLSVFDNILLYYTQFNSTSLNNCIFERCILLDTNFENVSLNICVFRGCEIKDSDFSNTKLSSIKWEQSDVRNTGFENADIKSWEWVNESGEKKTHGLIEWINNTYIDSQIEDVTWRLMDLSCSVFTGASIVKARFICCKLKGCVFDKTNMTSAIITHCKNSEQCSFRYANLYNALINDCSFIESNFYFVTAMESTISDCDFKSTDCSEMNLRKAELDGVIFDFSRLFQTTFNSAKIIKCRFKNVLGDGLQFTYVDCSNSDFSSASMTESNFSGTIFKECTIDGTGMSDSVYYGTVFNRCRLNHADYTRSRFVDAKFLECNVFKSCELSGCTFERVVFKNIEFDHCDFSNVCFSDCKFINVSFKDCISAEELLTDRGANEIIKCYKNRLNGKTNFNFET